MKRPMKLLSIITSVTVLLPVSLAMAQQPTTESSPPMQMQSPAATQASPSLQPSEQGAQAMQKMNKMADSVTKMSEMCQMMMQKEMAGARCKMVAGIAFGVVLFLDLLLLVILEIQWIIYWSRKLKSEKAKET
jgi:hypothetical protein